MRTRYIIAVMAMILMFHFDILLNSRTCSTKAVAGSSTKAMAGSSTKAMAGSSTKAMAGSSTKAMAGSSTKAVAGSSTKAVAGSSTKAMAGSSTKAVAGSSTKAVAGSSTKAVAGSSTKTVAVPLLTSMQGIGGQQDSGFPSSSYLRSSTLKLTQAHWASSYALPSANSMGASSLPPKLNPQISSDISAFWKNIVAA